MAQTRPHPQDGLARSQIVQTGPLAQVQCILNNDGEWMLRTYINDSDIERIRLERIQGVQHSIESEDRSGTSLAQVMTLSDGVILKPFRGSLLASANTKKRSSGVLKGNGQQGAEKGTTAPARRKIRLRDNSTTLYDPNIMPDFSAVKMVKPDITALFKGTSTTGWDGVVPNEAGKWHFHTCGGNEWTDSSEGIAAAEMGGQGIFEPDTNHPTAQDVYDYKKCYKRHGKGVADRSQNVTIVWRPDSWPLAHQRTEVEDPPAEAIAGAVSGQVVDFAASSNGASAANEVPVSPRSVPAPNENARTTHLENVEDSSRLMPPPAAPFDPAGNTCKKSRTSNASASSRRSSGRAVTREDTPRPERKRKESAKRKSSEADSGSGSPPKAPKLGSSSRTSWPSKNSLGNTLKIFDRGLKRLSTGKNGGDAQTKAAAADTVAQEPEVEGEGEGEGEGEEGSEGKEKEHGSDDVEEEAGEKSE